MDSKNKIQQQINDLAVKAQTKSESSVEELFKICEKFILATAKKFLGYGFPIEDLLQVARIGFLKSIENYNPEMGVFTSFSRTHMRAELFEHAIKNFDVMKVATTKAQRKLFFNRKLFSSREFLSQQEAESISKELEVPVGTVTEMHKRMYWKAANLDAEIFEEGGNLYDVIPSKEPEPCEQIESLEQERVLSQALCDALNNLDLQERDIVLGLYVENKTLECLGVEWGISAEGIRQKEALALEKLRSSVVFGD